MTPCPSLGVDAGWAGDLVIRLNHLLGLTIMFWEKLIPNMYEHPTLPPWCLLSLRSQHHAGLEMTREAMEPSFSQ